MGESARGGLVDLRRLALPLFALTFLLAFLGAAVLLPTVDPVSLFFEAVPLFILFELSIWLSVLMERRWRRAETNLATTPS